MTTTVDQTSAFVGSQGPDIATLHAALTRLPDFTDVAADDIEPMPVKGVVHAHLRIRGRGAVLRVPRLSQFGLDPQTNLTYQSACFVHAQPSGATPAFRAAIPIGPALPYGALVVEEIVGDPPRLPDAMAAIADALAAIHVMAMPAPEARAPLAVHDDPVSGMLGFIDPQAAYLPDAGIDPDSARQIAEELDWARRFAAEVEGRAQPLSLVGTDTHPGNFLIERSGRAVFVDLEKALYGSPAADLAHASIYTSTMWEADSAAVLERDAVAAFYARYLDVVPAALADGMRPWLAPMRRLVWLRTTTWCARWRVEAAKPAGAERGGGHTSVWSADRLAPALAQAVRARTDDYFDPETIARIRAEWLGSDRLELT